MALKKNYDPLAGLFGSNTASTKVSNETKVNKAEQTSAKSESNEAKDDFMNPPEKQTKEEQIEEEPEQQEDKSTEAVEVQPVEEQKKEEQTEEEQTEEEPGQQKEQVTRAEEEVAEQPTKTEEEAVEQLAEPQEEEQRVKEPLEDPAEEQQAKPHDEQPVEEQQVKPQDSQLSKIEKLMEEANIAPEALIGFLKDLTNNSNTSQQKTDMEQPEQTEITEQKKEAVVKIEHTPEELAYIQIGLLIPKEIKRFVEKTAKQNGIGASALLEQILNHEYEIKSPIYENEIEDYLDDFIKISKSNIRTNYRIPTYLKTFLVDSASENGVNQNVMLAFFIRRYQKELERTKWASLANRATM